MPKLNVYLPDALADRVRKAGLPVSSICQSALSAALDEADSAAALSTSEGFDIHPDLLRDYPLGWHVAGMLSLAPPAAQARGSSVIEPEDILQAMLDEGESLTLQAMERTGFTRDIVQDALTAETTRLEPPVPDGRSITVSQAVHRVLDRAIGEARDSSYPRLTGTHILLGLVDDEDSAAGRALRKIGLDHVLTRNILRVVTSAVLYGRSTPYRRTSLASDDILKSILERLDRIESRLGESPD